MVDENGCEFKKVEVAKIQSIGECSMLESALC